MENDQSKSADSWFDEGLDCWFKKTNAHEALKCFNSAIEIDTNHYKAYAERGNLYRFLGKVEEAKADLDKSIEIKPNASAYYVKGRMLNTLGKKEECNQCLMLAESQIIEDEPTYFHKATVLHDLGQLDKALSCYDQVIHLNPNNTIAYDKKGLVLYRLGKREEALMYCDQAIKINPSYDIAYNNKAAFLSEMGRKEEAISCFDEAIKLNPKNAAYYTGKVRVLIDLDRKEEALCCYDDVIKIEPNNAMHYIGKGYCLYTLDKNEEALQWFDEAIKLNPKSAKAYSTKGKVLHVLGRKEEAISCFEQSIKLNSNDSTAYNYKGLILSDSGREEEAIACFDEAIKINPKNCKFYIDKGNSLCSLNRNEEAITCFDHAIKLDHNSDKAHSSKAKALYTLGKNKEAIDCYNQAIKINPQDSSTYANKGVALYSLGEQEQAMACYEKAIQLNPQDPTIYSNKGMALFDLGDKNGAIVCYEKAIELDPKNASAYNNKGLALSSLGNKDKAIPCYDQAIKLNPSNPLPYNNKGLALTFLGEEEEAITCYDQAIKLDPNNPFFYCNKGKVLNRLGQEDKALECFGKAFEVYQVLQNNDRASLLEKLRDLQEASIETGKVSGTLSSTDERAVKLKQVFLKIKEEKAQLTDLFITNLDKGNKEDISEEVVLIDQMYEELLELKQQMIDFKKKFAPSLQDIASEERSNLEKEGVSNGFKDLQSRNAELYIYCKTFYWTIINLLGAYRSLSAGMTPKENRGNPVETEKLLAAGAQRSASYGGDIMKGLPFESGLIRGLDDMIESVYNVSKGNEAPNKAIAVNKVIHKKFEQEEDVSLSVGKLALAITKVREQTITGSDTVNNNEGDEGVKWLNKKAEQLKSKVLLAIDMQDKDSRGVILALGDVVLLISYVCANYEEIVRDTTPLETAFENIIKSNRFEGLVKSIGKAQLVEKAKEENSEVKRKLEDGRKKLQEQLSKQTFRNNTENQYLTDYYNSFVRTFLDVYMTSKVIGDPKTNVEFESNPDVGVLSVLVSFAPKLMLEIPSELDGIDKLLKNKETTICAKRVKLLASSPETLVELVSEVALEILNVQAKQNRITSVIEEKVEKETLIELERQLKDILAENARNEVLNVIKLRLYKETYKTLGARRGNYDANTLIQVWLDEEESQSKVSEYSKENIKKLFIDKIALKDINDLANKESSICLNSCEWRCNIF